MSAGNLNLSLTISATDKGAKAELTATGAAARGVGDASEQGAAKAASSLGKVREAARSVASELSKAGQHAGAGLAATATASQQASAGMSGAAAASQKAGSAIAEFASSAVQAAAGISRFNAGIEGVEARLATMGATIDATASRMQSIGPAAVQPLAQAEVAAERTGTAVSRLGALVSGAFAVGSVAALATKLVSTSDAMTNMASRLRLVTSSSTELAIAQDRVYEVSQRTRQALDSTSQVYYRLSKGAQELGLSQAQIAAQTETVNQAVALSGASAEAASASLLQFGQALASGVLRGDELNSIMEQTPGLAEAIAKGLGVGIGELRKLGEQGALTTQVIMEALRKAAPEVARQFAQLTPTVAASWTTLENSAQRWIGQANSASGATTVLASSITYVSGHFDEMARIAVATGTVLAGMWAGKVVSAALTGETATAVFRRAVTMLTGAQASNTVAATAQAGATRSLGAALGVVTTQATAASGALTVARGVVATLGGAFGVVITALSLAGAAWIAFGQRAQTAADMAKDAAREIQEQSAKLGITDIASAKLAVDKQQKEIQRLNEDLKNSYDDPKFSGIRGLSMRKEIENNIKKHKDYLIELKKQQSEAETRQKNFEETLKKSQFAASDSWEKLYQTKAQKQAAAEADLNKKFEDEKAKAKGNNEVLERLEKEHRVKMSVLKEQFADKKVGSGKTEAKKQENQAENYTQKLREQTLAQASLSAVEEQLYDADKKREELLAKLASGTLKLTEAQKAAALAHIDVQRAVEVELDYRKRLAKAQEEATKEATGRVAGLSQEVDKLREHNQEIGLTKAQLNALTLARADDAIATAEQRLTQTELTATNADYVSALMDEIALLKAKREELAKGQAKEAAAEQAKVATDAAKKATEEWQKASEQISQSLTDALMRGFEDGKGFAQNFRDTVANLFKTLVLRPTIQAIVQPVAGQLTSALGGQSAGGIQGIPGVSPFSTASSLYSLSPSLGIGYSAGSVMTSYGASALSGGLLGAGTQGGMLAAQTGAFGAAGAEATASALLSAAPEAGTAMAGSFLGAVGAALPWIAGGLMVANALGLFGDNEGPAMRTSNQAPIGGWDTSNYGDLYRNNQWFSDAEMGSALSAFAGGVAHFDDVVTKVMTPAQLEAANKFLSAADTIQWGIEGEDFSQGFAQLKAQRSQAVGMATGTLPTEWAALMDSASGMVDSALKDFAQGWVDSSALVAQFGDQVPRNIAEFGQLYRSLDDLSDPTGELRSGLQKLYPSMVAVYEAAGKFTTAVTGLTSENVGQKLAESILNADSAADAGKRFSEAMGDAIVSTIVGTVASTVGRMLFDTVISPLVAANMQGVAALNSGAITAEAALASGGVTASASLEAGGATASATLETAGVTTSADLTTAAATSGNYIAIAGQEVATGGQVAQVAVSTGGQQASVSMSTGGLLAGEALASAVAQIKDYLQTVAKVLADPGVQGALKDVMAVSGGIGSATYGAVEPILSYRPNASQEAQQTQADQAAENAKKRLEQIAKDLQRAIDAIDLSGLAADVADWRNDLADTRAEIEEQAKTSGMAAESAAGWALAAELFTARVRHATEELAKSLASDFAAIATSDVSQSLAAARDQYTQTMADVDALTEAEADAAKTAAIAAGALDLLTAKVMRLGAQVLDASFKAAGRDSEAMAFTTAQAGYGYQAGMDALASSFGTTADKLNLWLAATGQTLAEAAVSYWGTFTEAQQDAAIAAVDAQSAYVDALHAQANAVAKTVQDLASQVSRLDDFSRSVAKTRAALMDTLKPGAADAWRQGEIDRIQTQLAQVYQTGPERVSEMLDLANQLSALTTERYQAEIDSVKQLRDFTSQLSDYLANLRVGDLAPTTTGQKLAEAKKQFDDLAASAVNYSLTAEERQAAQGKLTGAADTLLNLGRDYYASGSGYSSLYSGVEQALIGLGADTRPVAERQLEAQQQIEALTRQQVANLDNLAAATETLRGQTVTRQDAAVAQLGSLGQQLASLGALPSIQQTLSGLPAGIAAELAPLIRGVASAPERVTATTPAATSGTGIVSTPSGSSVVQAQAPAAAATVSQYTSSAGGRYLAGAGGQVLVSRTGQQYSLDTVIASLQSAVAAGDWSGIYRAAVDFGMTSDELAQLFAASGWASVTGSQIRDWVASQGLPSFAVGADMLPADMLAQVHAGERIIPAGDNRELIRRLDAPVPDIGALLDEMALLRQEVAALRAEARQNAEGIARATADASDRAANKIVAGADSADRRRWTATV